MNKPEIVSEHKNPVGSDHSAFFFGKISTSTAALIAFFITDEYAFLMLSFAMIAFMIGDAQNAGLWNRLNNQPNADWREWQRKNNLLTIGFSLLMGAWCFMCFTLTDNLFMHLLCIATVMGNVLSIAMRTFTDQRILTFQLFAIGLPTVAGAFSYGDIRAMILCSFFIPMLTSVRDLSVRLNELFQGIRLQSREKEEFGAQLNEALESMSHGLLMFDEEMKVKIINRTARKILNLEPSINCYSRTLNEVARIVEMKRPSVNRVKLLENAIQNRFRSRIADKVFEIDKNKFVELSIMLRDEGGCVVVIEDVSERIQYQTRINQLAKYDELTGLYNRSFFLQQAKAAMENAANCDGASLIFFDLDEFKRINDTLGHEAGDHILTTVAQRVRDLLPRGTLIGRYGGDEFVIMLQAALPEEELGQLSQKVLDTITRPITHQKHEMRFGASVGIARYPEDGRTVDRLLKLADLALYAAKNNGKNCYRFFSADLEDTLHERLAMEHALDFAVKNKELSLHFQPIVNLDSGRVAVFEALTRWQLDGKNISPAFFIPLAEDLGLIEEIGAWTLMEACRQCTRWPKEVGVAVNVSAVQFQVGSITNLVRGALAKTGLDPSRLEIEITETAVLNDMDHAIVVLEQLSDLGVRISLDDFGTGYSSLSYLHKLPLDKMKIDKSFIDDITVSERSRTLLKGISVLGKALELKVVVEGIETEEQKDLLCDNYSVDMAQGYYFSRAMPADQALKFANNFHPSGSTSTDYAKPVDSVRVA